MAEPNQQATQKPWEMDWVEKAKQAVVQTAQTVSEKVSSMKMPWELDWTPKGSGKDFENKRPVEPSKGLPEAPKGAYFSPENDTPGMKNVRSHFETQLKIESGLRHYGEDGKLIRSKAGAQGVAQIMPKTGESPGFGVLPLQSETEDEYRRFGFDYMVALEKKYKGDIRKALAAYNYGPTALDKAIVQSRRAGVPWETRIPKETQDYLKKILGKDNGKKG